MKNITKRFKSNSQARIQQTQATLSERFEDLTKKTKKANAVLQSVKRICKPITSVISFGFQKGCFGYDIPNLNPDGILNQKFGKSNVKKSLSGMLNIIDPNEDVHGLDIDGK